MLSLGFMIGLKGFTNLLKPYAELARGYFSETGVSSFLYILKRLRDPWTLFYRSLRRKRKKKKGSMPHALKIQWCP